MHGKHSAHEKKNDVKTSSRTIWYAWAPKIETGKTISGYAIISALKLKEAERKHKLFIFQTEDNKCLKNCYYC